MNYLPTFAFGHVSWGKGINNKWQAVGHDLLQFSQEYRSWIYLPQADYGLDAGMHFLEPITSGTHGTAFAINDEGVMLAPRTYWSPAEGFTPHAVPSLSGSAKGINDNGLIVAGYEFGGISQSSRAWMYDINTGGVTDLNSLIDPASGWRLIDAVGINNDGQIIGKGLFNDATRYFVLVVPEPTFLPIGVLTAAILLRRR